MIFTWTVKDIQLVMRGEIARSLGSADDSHQYSLEYRFGEPDFESSRHGIECIVGGSLVGSAVLSASGGASGIHEHSCVLREDKCFVAVGPFVVCLEIPRLRLLWSKEVDSATCFGIYPTDDKDMLISHGELEIAKLTASGEIVWSSSGADIFWGPIRVTPNAVLATDWEGRKYRFDLHTGQPT